MSEAGATQVRKPISKTVRFNVFKRDGFRCQYCGSHPPAVVLEIDHVTPVSKGGTNVIHNLITACFDCNRGKGAGLLSDIPQSLVDKAALLEERHEQLKAYERLLKKMRKAEEDRIDEVQEVFRESFTGLRFTPKFRESVRQFLGKLDIYQVIGAMSSACSKRSDNADQAVKYFCGICWAKIKEGK